MSKKVSNTPKKQPLQARSRETVKALLQATTYILIKNGYAHLTTNRVAERAGVNIASLYQFFPNKETLVSELHRHHVNETRKAAKMVIKKHQGQGMKEMIHAFVQAGIAAHSVNPKLHSVFSEEIPRFLMTDTAEGESAFPFEELSEFAEKQGYSSENAQRLAWMIRTVSHAVIHQGIIDRPDDLISGKLALELEKMLEFYLTHAKWPSA